MQDLTETRSLKHIFSAEDHLKNCDEMARLMDSQSQMEQTHKEIKAGLKQEEEALSSNVGKYLGFIRDKYEYRKTPCRWTWDHPTPGIKTLYRIDTWEEVDVRPMEDYERQQLLKFMEENPAVESFAPEALVVEPEVVMFVDELQHLEDAYAATTDEIIAANPPETAVLQEEKPKKRKK